MTDLSLTAAAIDPNDAGDRLPLHDALDSAIARVSLALRLSAAEAGAAEPVVFGAGAPDPGLQNTPGDTSV